MNPFEKHGISHLSASSLNTYRNEPAVWTMRYLFGIKDEVGPGAWRGTAVEAGLDAFLYKKDKTYAHGKAAERFELEAGGDLDERIEKERQNIAPMLDNAILGIGDTMPIARQVKIETYLEGIEIPVIGYLDYVFEDELLDLKTTLRLPSSIDTASPAHKRQVALYMQARKLPGKLLYATPKKFAVHEVTKEIADEHIADLARIARSLRTALFRSADAEEVAQLHAPDYSSFYWSNNLIHESENVRAWQ